MDARTHVWKDLACIGFELELAVDEPASRQVSTNNPESRSASAHAVTYSCAVCEVSDFCEMLSERDGLRGVSSAMAVAMRGDSGSGERESRAGEFSCCCEG